MPYITQDRRELLDYHAYKNINWAAHTAGDLNYFITKSVHQFFKDHGGNYVALATVTGVLENATQEFYRRIAVPYEDSKLRENGDVYDA